ncbi:Protein MbtH [Baekduia alba]|uniref:MbtH family protein n=1 Tax=Baekduia alba TaxID=2997333 RepID=UPI0023427DBF|nr:MbtH family protein [Baekduia alba]WCB95227.1 Protein MbtH [Baekduia alba]
MSLSPFDDPNGEYVVLANAAGARCLWPAWADVPAGWSIDFGPAARPACLARIEARPDEPASKSH